MTVPLDEVRRSFIYAVNSILRFSLIVAQLPENRIELIRRFESTGKVNLIRRLVAGTVKNILAGGENDFIVTAVK